MSPKRDRDDETGFADRWSRLKQDSRKHLPSVEKEPEAALLEDADATPDDRTDEEVLAALGLPDPDTLKPGDDFSAFMAKTVPAKLRSRALRRLWIANPVLANLDELVDYGEDFTDAATVIENLATGYQVGKGWADMIITTPKPLTAEDEDAEADIAETEAEPDTEPPSSAVSETESEADPTADVAPPTAAEDQAGSDENILAEAPVAPQQFPLKRRMRFRVAED